MAIVYPPNECFSVPVMPVEQITGGYFNDSFSGLKKNPAGGMLAYSHGHLFPRKGLVYPEAALHNNIMKGIVMTALYCLADFRPTVAWLGRVLNRINLLANRVYLSQVPSGINQCENCLRSTLYTRLDFMHKDFYTPACAELWNSVYYFLKHLGIDYQESWYTGRLVATLLEFEGIPYLSRLQDIAGIIDKQALIKHPRRELLRILKVYEQREHASDGEFSLLKKFIRVATLFSLLLYIPKIRRAFVFAVTLTDFSRLQFDDADSYYALLRNDYDYFGKPYEARKDMFVQLANSYGAAVEFE